MKKVLSLVTCLLVLVPVMANAEDAWYNGIYVGIGTGGTRVETDMRDIGLMPSTGEPIDNDQYSKTSITGKLFAGYRIMKYLAVELGYMKISDTKQGYCFKDATTGKCAPERLPSISPVKSNDWIVDIPLSAWTGYAVGLFPINDSFEVYGKIGAIMWESEVSANEDIIGGFIPAPKPPLIPAPVPPIYADVDDIGLAVGIGLNFNHSSGFGIRTEIEYFDISTSDYKDQNDNQIAPKFELDTTYQFSLSAFYNF